MQWTWPFKSRVVNDRYGEAKHSWTGDTCPDFLCVGAQKAGTTWLYQQLDSHPDFWMPPIKELHYFDELSKVQRARPPCCRDERDVRFVEYFPNLKVIFLARDPVERAWSHLSMEVHYGQIEPFDVTDITDVNRNLLRRGMRLRSYPSATVARWKRYVHPDRFRVYFFDDLQRNPAELRGFILHFLGADRHKPSERLTADYNSWNGMEKLQLTDKVRSHLAQFFKKELKTCAAKLGGPARQWPARYGFSLLSFFAWLVNNF